MIADAPASRFDPDELGDLDSLIKPPRRSRGLYVAGLLGLLAAGAAGVMVGRSELKPALHNFSAGAEAPAELTAIAEPLLPIGTVQEADLPDPLAYPPPPASQPSSSGPAAAATNEAADEKAEVTAGPTAQAPAAAQAMLTGRARDLNTNSAGPPAAPQQMPLQGAGASGTGAARPSAAPVEKADLASIASLALPKIESIAAPAPEAASTGKPAQQVSGALVNSDYPRAALKARAEGSVFVQFTVGEDGQPKDCAVTRSSGNAELDAATCRVIEQRFRYSSATDAEGNAIEEVVKKRYDWSVRSRR